MGNNPSNTHNVSQNNYYDVFWSLNNREIIRIRAQYKIIDVEWLDHNLMNEKYLIDEYFKKSPEKKEVVNNMLDYYLTHNDCKIYKRTDYLCNEKEKLCICNVHAEDFRKIFERANYHKNSKYISWIAKKE
jgi:hypothetical protein